MADDQPTGRSAAAAMGAGLGLPMDDASRTLHAPRVGGAEIGEG